MKEWVESENDANGMSLSVWTNLHQFISILEVVGCLIACLPSNLSQQLQISQSFIS